MRRYLRRIAICLLLGAITTVAVAWGCAFLIDITTAATNVAGVKGLGGQDWVILRHDRGSAVRVRALAVSGLAGYEEIYPTDPSPLPAWGRLGAQLSEQRTGEPFTRAADAYGWPMLSMWCGFAWDTEHWPDALIVPPLSAITVAPRPGVAFESMSLRALPLRLIWPGFGLGVALYGLPWFGLLFGRGIARRWLRRHRGLCLACGYDLRGAVHERCPECGVVVLHMK